MKNFFCALSFMLIVILISCSNHSEEYSTELLFSDQIIEKISDTLYFPSIESIQLNKNKLLVVDYELNSLIMLDTVNGLSNIIGKTGRGPGELLGPRQFYQSGDTLLIYSDGKLAIDMFLKEKYFKTINLPPQSSEYSGTRFFMKNNKIYLPGTIENQEILVLSLDDYDKHTTFMKNTIENQKVKSLSRHILPYDNQLVGVGYYYPDIVIYNYNEEQLDRHDFSNTALMRDRMIISNEDKNDNSYFIFVEDACIAQDELYLLIINNEEQMIYSNKVLVFDLQNLNAGIKRIYELGDGWYSSLAVSDKQIWAYNSGKGRSQIERFTIRSTPDL